jgi:hypothetical protein
MLKTELMSD